jgi:peptidoglycan/LPS O-acetylase OafA/YrhL
MSHPAGLLVLMIPFIAEAELVQPESFEMYAMTSHGFWIGLLAFFIGFLCVHSGQVFWTTVTKWRWLLLVLAASLYTLRFLEGQFNAPYYLKSIESNLWIFALFGFGHRYLNKPSKALNYLSQSAYPIYIIHMVILYMASWLIFPLEISAILKYLLVTAFTFIGCFGIYEFVLKRIKFVRPLFGLKV